MSVWPLVPEEIKARSEEIPQKSLSLGKRTLFSFTFSFRFCFCSCPHGYHCLKNKKGWGQGNGAPETRARREMPRGSVRKGRSSSLKLDLFVTNLLKSGPHESPPAGCRFLSAHKAERQAPGLRSTPSPGRLRAGLVTGLAAGGRGRRSSRGSAQPGSSRLRERLCAWLGAAILS